MPLTTFGMNGLFCVDVPLRNYLFMFFHLLEQTLIFVSLGKPTYSNMPLVASISEAMVIWLTLTVMSVVVCCGGRELMLVLTQDCLLLCVAGCKDSRGKTFGGRDGGREAGTLSGGRGLMLGLTLTVSSVAVFS